jgi:hypothetical protein
MILDNGRQLAPPLSRAAPRASSSGPHRCGSLATSVDEPLEGRSA